MYVLLFNINNQFREGFILKAIKIAPLNPSAGIFCAQSAVEAANSKFNIKPFLKWAGGKRWFVHKYLSMFPANYNRYIEPFLGSAAVFFSLQPKEAILSDVNEELIETYQAMQVNWKKVLVKLKEHQKNHSREYYYRVRKKHPRSMFSRAARFIYLNKTCWNGLFRVNMKGEFNVPIGTKTNILLDTEDFEEISILLGRAEIIDRDFGDIIDQAEKDDLLFIDPPYTVKHNNNGFLKYNGKLFSWDDQVRLSLSLKRAKGRGVHIVLTNAYHSSIIELYQDSFELIPVARNSVIAGNSIYRRLCEELIIKG